MALLDHIILNENAYFYRIPAGFSLSTNRVNQIFTEVSRERTGNFTLKKVKQAEALGTVSVYYSLCIFKFEQRPTFLDEDVADILESKYAYLLIIEYSDFIVIVRKNVEDLHLIKELDSLDYVTISRVYITDQTKFERLSMKNMDIANTAVRNKVIEANNVQETMSNIGAGKYIVNNMRIKDIDGTKSLSFNTSRISKIDRKVKIVPLLNWTVQVVNRAKAFTGISSFMDVFAIPIDFESNITSLTPASILFSISDIKSDLESGQVDKMVYEGTHGRREIPVRIFLSYLNKFDTFAELIADTEPDTYKVINSVDKSLHVRVNKKSITLGSKKLKNLNLVISGVDVGLLQYLNQRNDFIVGFDRIETIYFSRKLFKDARLLTNLDNFLSAFVTNDDLAATTSEKGTITAASTAFDNNSVFGIVENRLTRGCEFLFCDDLGTEWADYISIHENSIDFYHAKSNGENSHGISASKFQDVVGQALKNLGNLIPAEHPWAPRATKWAELYAGTRIPRLRIGPSVAEGIARYKELVFKPNVRKRIFLVVDFISKANLTDQFHKMLAGEEVARKNELVQVLWFISSLISTCAELGFDVYIVCQP